MQPICPICGQQNGPLLRHFHAGADRLLLERLCGEAPGWRPADGACSRCVDQAQVEELLEWPDALRGDGGLGEVSGYKILPTPVRVQAHPCYRGRGVTICFIDSGFYPHPDLAGRIAAFRDLTRPERGESIFRQPHPHSWHGTMTAVVGAGDGCLSDGLYYGLAREARLVLLKVMGEDGRIGDRHIVAAIDWAIEHRAEYGIRVINLSLGGEAPDPVAGSPVDRAVAAALAAGIIVVAAAGNDAGAPVLPPASSPEATTVGGLDDHNTLDPLQLALYHSTYGRTPDGFFKPELIAPAVWIAAPLLPGSPEQAEARVLFDLWATDDRYLAAKLANVIGRTRLEPALPGRDAAAIRAAISERIGQRKYISAHYQHADGTSFAAPIVSGLIAQMLEANPALTPAQVKEHLLGTARPLPHVDIARQGYGVVQPARAVLAAAGAVSANPWQASPFVDYRRRQVRFLFRHPGARIVRLAGAFTRWEENAVAMTPAAEGEWSASIPLPPPGIHAYKFLVDGVRWVADPRNRYREPDGFNGFNSQLIIQQN